MITTATVFLAVPQNRSSFLLHPKPPASAAGQPVLSSAAGPARGGNAPPWNDNAELLLLLLLLLLMLSTQGEYDTRAHILLQQFPHLRCLPPLSALFPYGPHLERELNLLRANA